MMGSVYLDMETGGQRGEGGLGHTHWNKWQQKRGRDSVQQYDKDNLIGWLWSWWHLIGCWTSEVIWSQRVGWERHYEWEQSRGSLSDIGELSQELSINCKVSVVSCFLLCLLFTSCFILSVICVILLFLSLCDYLNVFHLRLIVSPTPLCI